MERTDDDPRRRILWMALLFSGAVHVAAYLAPWTPPAPTLRLARTLDTPRAFVSIDAVADGEESGGRALSSATPNVAPQRLAALIPRQNVAPPSGPDAAPRRPAARPLRRPLRAPHTSVAHGERREAPSAPLDTAEPTEEHTEAADPGVRAHGSLLPEDAANQQFLEELMRRPPLAGLGGAGDGTGGETGGRGCPDPVVGTWRARRYDGALGRHVVFTLRITAHDGSRLEGTILNRSWSGSRSERHPPRCAPGVSDHTVTMPARGRLVGGSFRLDALSHRRTNHCFDVGLWMYNLDHFTGTLDGDTLRVVNNDGGHERNSPYVFERIACH